MSTVPWLGVFLLASAVLIWAGIQLAGAGDAIAERTGRSRLLVGMLLLAGATSLPELVTDVSAAVAGAPDLAVGDLFGSSIANMAILAVVDLLSRRRAWPSAEIGQARVAAAAIALTGFATLGVLTPGIPSVAWVGLDTLAIGAAYVAAVAWIRRSPAPRFGPGELLPVPTGWTSAVPGPLKPRAMQFAIATFAVLLSAPALAYSARELADASGIGQTFVGTALLATSTSLPELVASVAAVRIGAHDLAIGNLFGSNAMNMAVLLVADAAYTDGPILQAVSPGQAVGGVGAIVLMALALAAIVHGVETRVRRLEPDAVMLLAAYAAALFAVWRVGSP